MVTLSVVIAVKNEEAIIRKCLEAVAWADEIVIIDNGSTDNTVKICKQYTKKIYSFPEKTLIPILQNKGIEKATKEWVLILDADVIVPKEAVKEIQEKIKDTSIQGYYLLHKTYIAGKFMKSSFWSFNILKLFKKGYGYFPGKNAHESIQFNGNAGNIIAPLLHYSHLCLEVQISKLNLYSSQDAQQLCEQKKGGLLKRRMKKASLFHLIIYPFIYFMYLFIYRYGFKDGIHGCIVDCNMAIYTFLESAKMWEFQQREGKYDN
jgi:glycosyltransferase involved in cell wall biosynthesis